MSVILLKFAPWIAAALVCLGIGGWAGHKAAQPAYNRLASQYEAFQLTVAHDQAAGQKAATEALQAQINERNATEARNAQLEQSLHSIQDRAAERDADFARRLLAAARKAGSTPGPDSVSKGKGEQHATDPPDASGDRSLTTDLGDAAGECTDAIQRLAALQLEITTQVQP
ncbi:MAG TPA: hypothetical protein VLQ80_08185 [Candidatus Saccharimonadia bacterium]|nr:hypothetical protein [Candidatus Saccharimonadia bacterium]